MPKVVSLAFAALLALEGCATALRELVAARVQVVPSRQLVIRDVQVASGGSSTRVSGRVSRRSLLRGPVWGRIHIEAWGSSGLLAARDTSWSRLSKRRLPSSHFFAELSAPPGEVEEIRISHVVGSHRHPCSAGTCQ